MVHPTALLFLFVGIAAADNAGWKPGYLYRYNIEARTLTGIHQVANQYTGTLIKGKAFFYPETDKITLQLHDLMYVDLNQQLEHGWDTYIDYGQLSFKPFPVKNDVFQMYVKNGVFQKMVVDSGATSHEVNFLKALASQFQVDLKAQNLKRSQMNDVPKGQQQTGIYKTMEESVNGEYETLYDVSILPEYIAEYQPELVPVPSLRGDGFYYNVHKTRNFSASNKHIVYRYGFSGHEGWDDGTNQMGNFLSRASQSRIVLSGTLNKYTIQSTVTTEKVIVAPHMYNSQKGIVASRMNLTLEDVSNSKGSVPSISSPKTVESLVYEYGHTVLQSGDSSEHSSSSSSSSSSSESGSASSSSSSEENNSNQRPSDSNHQSDHRRSRRSSEWNLKSHESSHPRMNNGRNGGHSHGGSSSSSSSSEDSSISSSEEYLSPQPNLNDTPVVEFLPEYVVSPRKESGQTGEQIVRIARQIGQYLQNPSDIPKEDVLAYFSILSHVTATATSDQLEQVTSKLYYPQEKVQGSSDQDAYYNYRSWQVYRDAVAQAGTGPALVTIGKWIKSGQVAGNEGAQILAVLPKAARFPTTEYMDYFFELVKSGPVQNQKYVNDSAILSFADLVRRSQVDRESARHRYPIHLTGSQSQNHRAVVSQKYIPYFQNQLQKAVTQGDSIKTQIYIRALSNTAHPDIWAVFEPYLEGKTPISNFQRLVIIAYLGDVIKVHPNTARNVLYRIYQNQGDAPEVRVAAVMQLMKTNPPPQILQRLAQETNHDHSEHVKAAVKSAIESAAKGEIFADPEFVQNARAAANFLTSQQYGFQYSQNFLRSYISKEHDTLEYKHYLAYIKGLEGIYPNSILYSVESKKGGYVNEPRTASFMSSSSEELFGLLFEKLGFFSPQQRMMRQKQGQNTQYSYQKVKEGLNGEYDQPFQVEGNFFTSFMGIPRFFAFDNHTVEAIPYYFSQFYENFQKGLNFHETKFFIPFSVEIAFPLATGVPFFYFFSEPTLAFADFQSKGNYQQQSTEYNKLPFTASVEGTYQFTYSTLKRGKMGFVAPYNHQKYVASVEKKLQFYFPVKGKFEFDGPNNSFRGTFQPYSEGNSEQSIFHHSTDVYTTYQDIFSYKPYLQGNYRPVQAGPYREFKTSFGQEYTGYDFQVEAGSENNFQDFFRAYKALKTQDYDYITSLIFHDLTHTIANNYYAVKYYPQNSSSENVQFSVYFDKQYEGSEARKRRTKTNANIRNRRNSAPVWPSSLDTRVDELLAGAFSDIPDAYAYIFDFYASFRASQNKGQYVFTTAYAQSPVSEKSRFLAFINSTPLQESQYSKAFKAAVDVSYKYPQVPIFNYQDAYEFDPTSYVEGQVYFDPNANSKISFEGKLEQTEGRKTYASQYPDSYACQQQMQQNNYFQPSCRNASLHANVLDKYDFTFKYQNLPEAVQSAAYAFYSFFRHVGYQYNQEYFVGVKNEEGQFRFRTQFSEDLNYYNVSLYAPYFNSYFQNVTLPQLFRPFFVQYPGYNQLYYYSPFYFYTKPYGTCSFDADVVSTFNNRSYPIKVGDVYHVFAMTTPYFYQQASEEPSDESQYNYAILVKENGSQQKDVQIVLGEDAIYLKSSGSGVSIVANGEIVPLSDNKVAHWKNGFHQFEAYTLPEKHVVVLYFVNNGFEFYFDGYHAALSVSSHQRNRVRGLCGTFDGEYVNDFTTPANCVLRDYQQFAASYALPDPSYQGPIKEIQRQVQNAPCYPKEVVYSDVVSDVEAGRGGKRAHMSPNDIPRKNSTEKRQACSSYKVQIIKDQGKSCFSLKPQVACNANCRATKKMEKLVDFHCLPDTDNMTTHWLRMVKKGAKPDFSQKAANAKMRILLPESCTSS